MSTQSQTFLLSVATLVLLAGCDPVPRAVKPDGLDKLANSISYIKDGHGLCYAVLSTASYGAMNVASIANVPCDKVGL